MTPPLLLVKFGGSAFQPAALAPFAKRVHALLAAGNRVVVVHGGGKEITKLLDRLQKTSEFRNGLRVTDEDTLEATEQVLSGTVNKAIVRGLAANGIAAVGVAGTDAGLLQAQVLETTTTDAQGRTQVETYGHVGEVVASDPSLVNALLDAGYVPIVSPIASGGPAGRLNVNADTAAAFLAGTLHAHEFLLLTDVKGVMADGTVQPRLTRSAIERLRKTGVITGGMIPKVEACLAALGKGSKSARILHMDDFLAGASGAGTQVQAG